MKIEILYPEICNLYGDIANIRFLKESIPEAEIIGTPLQGRPRFLDEPVDMVYMGTTTENGQILALEQLRFLREQIAEHIEKGTNFLITGNAMELFGERIEEDGEEVARGLGIFPGSRGAHRSTGSTACSSVLLIRGRRKIVGSRMQNRSGSSDSRASSDTPTEKTGTRTWILWLCSHRSGARA